LHIFGERKREQVFNAAYLRDVANINNIYQENGMPRQPRLDAPGVLQHIMARGIKRRKIFGEFFSCDEKGEGQVCLGRA